jgi:serine/threonine protein kinase
LKSFAASVEILKRIDHPNITKCLDSGVAGDRPFIVLPFFEARTVRELILARDPFLSLNALAFIRQTAAALHAIHHAGYLHLDIKPENILVQDDGHVVLIDFDLALPATNLPLKIRDLPGTPFYRAPECITSHLVDERADVFSFGVTAYEMLTFHKPFEADTVEESRRRHLAPDVPPILMQHFNPEVPARVESIISKCLAKAPDKRYPATTLVLKDLESIV